MHAVSYYRIILLFVALLKRSVSSAMFSTFFVSFFVLVIIIMIL